MSLGFIIEMLFTALRGFLRDSRKAAPYAKWLIRSRDYLLLLFPLEDYPQFATDDVALKGLDVSGIAVPIETVKKEAKKSGFNIPFIKGI
jgi:hypothetical protein